MNRFLDLIPKIHSSPNPVNLNSDKLEEQKIGDKTK
jgi:hypothetical protein